MRAQSLSGMLNITSEHENWSSQESTFKHHYMVFISENDLAEQNVSVL